MGTDLRFDLANEPWLPVRLAGGEADEVSLRSALLRAHEITGLDLEFPTQEPALLRLLLACCYRAFEGPADDAGWRELWDAPQLPAERVDAYFDRWSGRFDLFSELAPFFQSPGLEPAGKGGVKPASKLVAHAPSGNNVPVFMPVTDATGLVLEPAEAARWLVERHAWGTASDKTGAKGNPRLKAGKDTPQIGHLAWIGFVAPIGRTLRETLLLNLVPWQLSNLVRGGPDDLPAWERDPLGAARRTRPPDGVCDLFTWQSRRIRLYPERRGDKVVVSKVLVCAGDEVDRDAARTTDPHVGWRSTRAKDGSISYSPLRARPGQQVWRGISSLLALEEQDSRAGVLSFLARLEVRGISTVSLLVTSAELGQMSTTLKDLVSDRLETPVAVLRATDPEAATVAAEAVVLAAAAARALGRVAEVPYLSYDEEARRHQVPEGRSKQASSAREALAEELYGALDAPYRRFLVELGEVADRDEARETWARTVTKTAHDLAAREMAQLSPAQAFAGAMAESAFRQALKKARNDFSPAEERKEGAA